VLLDLFCGEGGAAKGYQRAGFHVVGVDIEPQPNYCGDSFIQADAITVLRNGCPAIFAARAIHASPPCQFYSDLAKRNGNGHEWPDLVAKVRRLLRPHGKPYVIENVEGAPLRDPVMLCGTMFPGLRVLRHRLFETNWPLTAPPHGEHPLVFTHDKRKAHHGQLDQDTSFVQVTGGGNATLANKRAAMGMPWASNHGVNEAIPPAYAEHIGRQLIRTLRDPGIWPPVLSGGDARPTPAASDQPPAQPPAPPDAAAAP
jgi:DNA (cytosine-5)-methyltransferase 1